MEHCIYQKDEFIILNSSNGYVVVNTKGKYENHSHFNYSLNAAKNCIKFVQKRIVPKKSSYMFEACRRISIDQEYLDMLQSYIDDPKSKYINLSNLMSHDSYKRNKHGAIEQRR